ncbi:ATP-binding protein [Quadrisphaera sp. KR29]|uniref:ATP-binding protein n=1 Tax=Quadrisphaera sp. KR29 TaxID=3461391 RepID=UPI004043973A
MGDDRGAVTAWEQDAHVVSPSYPAQLESVRLARRFVMGVVEAVGLGGCADDAGLLVSELAANAVLHARTGFSVHLRPTLEGGVRVEVEDASPLPPVHTPHSASAMSGRGLDLVACTAVRWGSHPHGAGKAVWFEVEAAAPAAAPDLDTAQLLALWSDDDSGPVMPVGHPSAPVRGVPAGPARAGSAPPVPSGAHPPTAGIITSTMVAVEVTRSVELRDLPVAAVLAAEEAMDDLLRELQLVLLATPAAGIGASRAGGAPGLDHHRPHHEAELQVAARLDAAARGFESGRRQLREQVAAAALRGQREVTVRLAVPASARQAAADYRDAVEEASQLGGTGQLLAAVDSCGRHADLRRAYLQEVVRQLGA